MKVIVYGLANVAMAVLLIVAVDCIVNGFISKSHGDLFAFFGGGLIAVYSTIMFSLAVNKYND